MKKILSVLICVATMFILVPSGTMAEGEIEFYDITDGSEISPDDKEISISLPNESELSVLYLDGKEVEIFENTAEIFYTFENKFSIGKHEIEIVAISGGEAKSKNISFSVTLGKENYAFNFGFDGKENQDTPHANDFYYTGAGAGGASMGYATDPQSGNTYLKAVADGGEWSSGGAHDMVIHFYRNIPISTPYAYSYDVCISEVRGGYCMADDGAESYKMGIVYPDIKYGSSTYSGRKMAGVYRDKADGKLKIAKNPGTDVDANFISYASMDIEEGKWYTIKTYFDPARNNAKSYATDIESGIEKLICEDKNFTLEGAITDLQLKAWGKADILFDNFRLHYTDGNVSFEKDGEYIEASDNVVGCGTQKIKISRAKYLSDADVTAYVSATENGQKKAIKSAVIAGGDIEVIFEKPLLFQSDVKICLSEKTLLSDKSEVGYLVEYSFKTSSNDMGAENVTYKVNEKDILTHRQLKGGDTVKINAEMINLSGGEKNVFIAAYAYQNGRICAVKAIPCTLLAVSDVQNMPLEVTLPLGDGAFNIKTYVFESFKNAVPLSRAYEIK